MATRSDSAAKTFAEYVRDAAHNAGYALDSPSGKGRAVLAKAADMPESDISKILTRRFEVPTDLLKPLAAALDVPQQDLLKAAGVLEGKAPRPNGELSVRLAAHRLGIRSPKNVAAFETLVEVLRDAEKRR
ncbi:hypothetical protein [Streptomyces sp. MBT62]|uniref:hypothetical protein n=1 Tax=Streptomyces sp. MBT62 TaxID=2800410 RepID=UPI001909215E|nr:hypothetical protein [Streptomyces sp. MBT62]MBK3569889.1 hypothetical protein [Streptomyces sp. MBT62]